MQEWKVLKTISKGNYIYALVPDHPNSTENGYVLMHRIIVENNIKRLLTENEVIHHIDGDTYNNKIENLKLMTNSEHTRMHRSLEGRTYVTLKCPECEKVFNMKKNNSYLNKGGRCTFCSRSCSGKFSRKEQLNGISDQMKQKISENFVKEYKKFSASNSIGQNT